MDYHFEVPSFCIMAVAIFVSRSQKRPCFNVRMELEMISWLDMMETPCAGSNLIPCFILSFTLNGIIIYKMNIMLHWRRLATGDGELAPCWRIEINVGLKHLRIAFAFQIQNLCQYFIELTWWAVFTWLINPMTCPLIQDKSRVRMSSPSSMITPLVGS